MDESVVGLYGLEVRRGGVVSVASSAEWWRSVVADAAARSEAAGLTGLAVEPKGLSLTLRYRSAPGLEARVTALAEEIAAATGLVVRAARRSVELHPQVDADKGTAACAGRGRARRLLPGRRPGRPGRLPSP